MQRLAARRWLVATGIAAALVVAPAVSAGADTAPTLGVIISDTLLAPGSGGTEIDPVVVASEPVTVHDLTVTFDVSGITSFMDVDADSFFCHRDADIVTCVFEDEETIDEFGMGLIGPTVSPKAGAAAGDEGDVTVTVSADGFDAVTDTAKVSIGEGVNLAAEVAPANLSKAPGSAYDELVGVQNVGETTAHGAVLVFFGDYGIEAGSARHSNCTYDGDQYRACTFDTDLVPDKAYGHTFPFQLRSDTLAPSTSAIEFAWLTPAEWDAFKAYLHKLGNDDVIGQPGSGAPAALAEKAKGPVEQPEESIRRGVQQTDVDASNNFTFTEVSATGHNSADVAAFGDQATGAAGDIVTVHPGIVNNGPAAIDHGRSAEFIAELLFTVPPGATVTQAPLDCYPVAGSDVDFEHPGQAGKAKYLCGSGIFLAPGDKTPFEFKLRITTATPNAKGEVKVTDFFSERPLPAKIDSNPANDKAYVVLNGTGESAAPSPGDDNGGLPVTGTPVALVTAAGLLVLAVGFVIFRIARRRRLTEV